MSTFIKVTQEGSELLRRNAEQMQGSRLAKLEGDEQRRTEQQARQARQQALQQQGRDASGDVVGGTRRRRFRLDEPAATRIVDEALIIVWIDGKPALKNRNGVIIEYYGLGGLPSSIDDLGGVPAVEVIPFLSGGEYTPGFVSVAAKPNVKAQYLSSCTLEAWGELVTLGGGPVNSRYAVDIRMGWDYQPGTTTASSSVFCIYDFAPSGYSNPLSIPPYSRGPGLFLYCQSRPEPGTGQAVVSEEDVFISSSPPVGGFHICIQIADYQVSYYIDGLLIKRYALPSLGIPTEKLQMSAIVSSSNTLSTAKISDIRFTTTKARYPLDGFTPDLPPFR